MANRNHGPKRLTGQPLKDFRHKVAGLKARGLTSKKVDARSQKPTRYMQAKVRRLEGVFTGEKAAVKLKPKIAREYKEAGFTVINNRVLIDKTPDEIVKVSGGRPVISKPLNANTSYDRTIMPWTARNIHELLVRMRGEPEAFNALKPEGQYFAFKIFGNNSRNLFEEIEGVVEELEKYEVLFSGDEWADEAFESLEFWHINHTFSWPRTKAAKRVRTEQDRREAETKRNRYARMGRSHYQAMDAERKRKAREMARAQGGAKYDKYLEREKTRKAELRANPAFRHAEKLKDKLRKKAFRDQMKADARNGYNRD